MSLLAIASGASGVISGLQNGMSGINAVSNGLNSAVSQVSSTLESLGLGSVSGFLDKGIGAVLSNGLNLSCWGTSRPTDVAQKDTAKDIEGFLTSTGIKANVNEVTLNKFIETMEGYKSWAKARKSEVSNSCTKSGYDLSHNIAVKLMEDMLTAIGKNYNVIPDVVVEVPANAWKVYAEAGKKNITNKNAFQFQTYKLTTKSGQSLTDAALTGNADGSTSSGGGGLLGTILLGLGINFISKQF
jgi:hypothetical protein